MIEGVGSIGDYNYMVNTAEGEDAMILIGTLEEE